jgi:hypothetical protein
MPRFAFVTRSHVTRSFAAGMVLAGSLAATAALAQTAPLSYAVPDSTAWSDILKNKAPMGRTKATVERKKRATAQRQAKARPAARTAAKTVAADEVSELDQAADVRIVAPDELNEIDRMAGTTPQ